MNAKIIGLTGGIGSGKTVVANLFKEKGIPIYNSDLEGKKITDRKEVIDQIIAIFGDQIVENGVVNRKKLAQLVFKNDKKLAQLNQIIHPLVKMDFENWLQKQTSPFIIKETAILFEAKINTSCDQIITVTAPLEKRIKRVMQRDQASREDIVARIEKQLPDAVKIAQSDFVIHNIELSKTALQVDQIYEKLIQYMI